VTETMIGTPLHDGQHDPLPCCFVCGTGKDLTRAMTDRPRPGDSEIVCRSCFGAAMLNVGPATSGHIRTCSGRHAADDEGRWSVVHGWPLGSAGREIRFACASHLRAALLALDPKEMTT
jgi:hypothetical protein